MAGTDEAYHEIPSTEHKGKGRRRYKLYDDGRSSFQVFRPDRKGRIAVEGADHTAEICFDTNVRTFVIRTRSGVCKTLEVGSSPKEALDAWCDRVAQWDSKTTEEQARSQLDGFYNDL